MTVQITLFDKIVSLDAKMENTVTKEYISNLTKGINDQKEIIRHSEDKVAILDNHVCHLMKENDELSQYQQRLCTRIHGIELATYGGNEISDDCLQKVIDVFEDQVVHIIYRARKNVAQYEIKLDLNKYRVNLLKRGNQILKNQKYSFAFCDVNFHPC